MVELSARCNECGATYTDKESIELVKKWLAEPDGYAPCSNLSCRGEMVLWDSDKLIHES